MGAERNEKTMPHTSADQLKAFFDQINHLEQPEDLFGHLGLGESEQLQRLETCYKSLVKSYHPDNFASQPAQQRSATEITKLLNALKQRAVIKIKRNLYGEARRPELRAYTSVIRTAQREYFVTELRLEGELADIYHAYYSDPTDLLKPWKEALIKIIADPADNPLVANELAFYQHLTHFCFPAYLDHFQVLAYVSEGCDLLELRRRYWDKYGSFGLPQEHLFWILDRFLCALGLLHENGILHGNLQPDNLIVQPKTHNGLVIDFLHCRISPGPDDVLDVVNPAYCDPEVFTRHFKPHPVSDIYALGRCMIELLGGHGDSLDENIPIDPRIRAFLQKMILPDPARRAADAWGLAEELKSLRRTIYGASIPFFSLEI
jgi:serine/threonine protein kinase